MEEAFASRESDRRMILNSIAGVEDLTTSPAESHVGSLVGRSLRVDDGSCR